MSLPLRQSDPKELCLQINARSVNGGLFEGDRRNLHPDSRMPWRISPEPFWISPEQLEAIEEMGQVSLEFYHACNLLYLQSVKGVQPDWVHRYLDRGKPSHVIEFGRMNRFRSHLPLIIRPDLLLTRNGFRIAELDAIPGGMGFTGHLTALYEDLGYDLIGGGHGLVDGFYEALIETTQLEKPVVAIIVSDESEPYREEMQWLASQLQQNGRPVFCRRPEEIHMRDEGIFVEPEAGAELLKVDLVYRFFELFDLKNIPKVELVAYFAKKNAVRVTPPLKAYLEEKMWLALFHHPQLRSYWSREMDKRSVELLKEYIPPTWVLDSTPMPPHAVIPGLQIDGNPVSSWSELRQVTKKQRELVVKPSGFTEMAYGSKGVSIGHDLPEDEWAARVQDGLDQFDTNPHILQEFHKSERVSGQYYDFASGQMRGMKGRVLLRPYFYVGAEKAHLSGMQAVVCPPDKKILHGMTEAILMPCAVGTPS